MTRIHRTLGLLALTLVVGSWAGCYFQRSVVNFDADGDGFDETVDCNDDNPAVYPGAPEICGDGVDNDCDGKTDSADPECDIGSGGSGGAGGSASGGSGGTAGAGGNGGGSVGGAGGSGGAEGGGNPAAGGNGGAGGT